MAMYKDFTPEVDYYPHPFLCWSSTRIVLETKVQTRERMNEWILKSPIKVISIETLPFQYDDATSHHLDTAYYRVWYKYLSKKEEARSLFSTYQASESLNA